jgi:hypothetical protein
MSIESIILRRIIILYKRTLSIPSISGITDWRRIKVSRSFIVCGHCCSVCSILAPEHGCLCSHPIIRINSSYLCICHTTYYYTCYSKCHIVYFFTEIRYVYLVIRELMLITRWTGNRLRITVEVVTSTRTISKHIIRWIRLLSKEIHIPFEFDTSHWAVVSYHIPRLL